MNVDPRVCGKVLHLFANYKWTGPADPAIRAAARLRDLGVDVTFTKAGFVHPGNPHYVAEHLQRLQLPMLEGLELRKHFHVPSLLRDVRSLRRLVQQHGYAILHTHLPGDHLLAALACRKLATPPAIVRTLYEPQPPPRGWRERYAFRRTAAVLAPTRAAQAGVVERFGLAADRVLHQEPVTEPRERIGPDLRARWGLDASHKVVGITARIQPHRRFELLWEIAARVVKAMPEARFVLLGRGNAEDTEALVKAPLRRLGLETHVVLPGYQREPEYSAALRSLDAFLFLVPGSDGTCRAVCEAMAFGLPVVATQRGILPELLAARRPGELPGTACREDAETMADALLRLLRDDGLRAAQGAAALRRAQLDMDPVRAAERTAELYAELARRP
ncbi:MAG: hypothetical protein RL398_3453 [Planctomycetota bacterium]|jgi:glycosyltransferase involved in cell wall biosynthesis